MDQLDLGVEMPVSDLGVEFPTTGFNIPTGDDFIMAMVILSVMLLVTTVLASAVAALLSGFIARHAQRRGRSFEYFYWASLLVPMATSLIVASVSPMTLTSLRVGCPGCAEQVSSLATKCPHCQQQLAPVSDPGLFAMQSFARTTAQVRRYSTWLAFAAGALWSIGVILYFFSDTVGIAPLLVTVSLPAAALATVGLVSLRARKKSLIELRSLAGV